MVSVSSSTSVSARQRIEAVAGLGRRSRNLATLRTTAITNHQESFLPLPETLLTAPLHDFDLSLVAGAWPSDLRGELYLSSPQIDQRLDYALFGFGAIVRVSLAAGTHGAPAGRFAVRTRVLDTPIKRLHDLVAPEFRGGRFGLESAFGHANMANTAPLAMGGRMFATWDVGRPVEFDPVSLDFLGEVGTADSWGGDSFGQRRVFPQIFSTAHPVVDAERNCLWTVKLVPSGGGQQVILVQWDANGQRVSTWPLDGAVVHGSMHSITQTRNWLVLSDSGNFKVDMNEVFGKPRTITTDESVSVFFVRKDVVASTPAGQPLAWCRGTFGPTTGHYFAKWDDDDGIDLLVEHMDLTDLGYRLERDDRDAFGQPINPRHVGFYNMAMSSQTISELHFDPATVEQHTAGHSSARLVPCRTTARVNDGDMWNLQLSAMDWSLDGLCHPDKHHVVIQGRRPQLVAQRVLQCYAGRANTDAVTAPESGARLITFERGSLRLHSEHRFAALDDLPSSPAFVQRPGGAAGGGDGWVVVSVLSDDGFRLEVFDAARVGVGPLAVLRSPSHDRLPFLLHSVVTATARPAVPADRLNPATELLSDGPQRALQRLTEPLRHAVQEVTESFVAR
jgi:carotenoid cleavage dioxygenase-like enzyme